jgi:folate-binding protein YgfZ
MPMSAAKITRLAGRGVVSVTGRDNEKLLQGLVTNDLAGLEPGAARFAALLSPQGKILFDFFAVRTAEGYLLDVANTEAPALVKRLTLYKLRADVAIEDVSSKYTVFALWGDDAASFDTPNSAVRFVDPRHPSMGFRVLADAQSGDEVVREARAAEVPLQTYDAERVRLGVPEGGKDYAFGDAYPHEADFDIHNGVSFTKGCYVGQEVVSRMQNKTVVRKRIVKVSGEAPLTTGADVLLGDVPIGRVATTDGKNALAMLRLDRALEAEPRNLTLTAAGITIRPDPEAMARYRDSVAAKNPSAARP